MEPDKTYQLHSDDTSQPAAPATPPVSQNDASPEIPSKYNQSTGQALSKADEVPWYLRPLTKTTQSPLTSTQTRPFVPRQPLPPSQQNYKPPQAPVVPQPQSEQKSEYAQPSPVSRETIQAPPLSPFRSPPVVSSAPTESWRRPSVPLSSPDRFQMPGQPPQLAHQEPAASMPKPFSQFGAPSFTRSVRPDSLKPTKARKLIGITLAVLLVAGVGAGVYALWRSSSNKATVSSPVVVANAEEKFYQAIDNHLSTSKVRQEYQQTITSADGGTVSLDTTSDFSDPRKPKSYIKYELTSGQGATAIDGAGELIIRDTNEYYAKLTKPAVFYEGDDAGKPKEGQWYVVGGSESAGELLMDPLSARGSINSSLGEFPVGNFSDGARQELMQFIRRQNVYKITSTDTTELDGVKMTHYNIDLNIPTINELNKKIYASLGGDSSKMPVTFTKSDTQKTEVWVSQDTTKIARIKIDRQSRAGEEGRIVREVTTVSISYPNDVTIINKPVNAIPGPWHKAG